MLKQPMTLKVWCQLAVSLALLVKLFGSTALTPEAAAQFPPAIAITEGKTSQGYRYLTGGASSDEREALEQQGKNFNLKLVFAASDGSFLANVKVMIADAKGTQVLATSTTGPWFFLSFPPAAIG